MYRAWLNRHDGDGIAWCQVSDTGEVISQIQRSTTFVDVPASRFVYKTGRAWSPDGHQSIRAWLEFDEPPTPDPQTL